MQTIVTFPQYVIDWVSHLANHIVETNETLYAGRSELNRDKTGNVHEKHLASKLSEMAC